MAKNSGKYLYNNGGGEDNQFEKRCQKLARAWTKKVEAPLQKRQKLLALWASGFFDSKYSRNHLINLIDRGVFTLVPYLVEGNPKVLVETKIGNARPWAYTTQLALNFYLNKMNFSESVLIPAAVNSMFGAGITRTYTEYNRIINLEDELIKYGTHAVRVIDDADYIGDVAAKTREDFMIEGEIYKLPTEYAKDLFSKHADDIAPDCRLKSEYHPEKIANGEWDINKLSLREYTTFIDLYLYDENVTITILPYGKAAKIFNTIEEDGPGESPYDFLGYKFFPGSTYPIPPAWAWHDLDVTMNILAKAAREQAESQKNLIFVDPQNTDLGKKVVNARNMDVLPVQNPKDGVFPVSLGGVNPENYNWMNFAELEFTKTGASPDVLGGRGAQAPTLGQEQLVFANASRIVNNMYTRFQGFMTSIVEKLAWKIWTDPTINIPLIHHIPGVGDLPKIFSAAHRVGDFYDFMFKIHPYSSQRTSPEVMYQKLMGFMTQWVLPTYEFAAQQGAELDIPTVTQLLSDYAGVDSINQWYRTATPRELEAIGYQMQPLGGKRPPGNNSKSPGQTNDTFGATDASRNANKQQQQSRTQGSPEGSSY